MDNNLFNGGMFRYKEIPFSTVSNKVVDDMNLSCTAKGLYLIIQRNITIPNYTLYKTTLKEKSGLGAKAFDKVWKELKEKGYLIQERHRDKETRKFYYIYDLLEEPNILRASMTKVKAAKSNNSAHIPKSGVTENDNHETGGMVLNTPILNHIHPACTAEGGKSNNTVYTTTTLLEEMSNKKFFESFKETPQKIQTEFCLKKIKSFLDKGLSEEAIECAINDAMMTTNGDFNVKYLCSILQRYLDNKIITAKDIEEDKNKFIQAKRNDDIKSKEAKKEKIRAKNLEKAKSTKGDVKKNTWGFENQREYDFEDLERKLLGWDKEVNNDIDI